MRKMRPRSLPYTTYLKSTDEGIDFESPLVVTPDKCLKFSFTQLRRQVRLVVTLVDKAEAEQAKSTEDAHAFIILGSTFDKGDAVSFEFGKPGKYSICRLWNVNVF